jgi:hypothetical protein
METYMRRRGTSSAPAISFFTLRISASDDMTERWYRKGCGRDDGYSHVDLSGSAEQERNQSHPICPDPLPQPFPSTLQTLSAFRHVRRTAS